jgi:hypothetical protein
MSLPSQRISCTWDRAPNAACERADPAASGDALDEAKQSAIVKEEIQRLDTAAPLHSQIAAEPPVVHWVSSPSAIP